MTILSMSLYQNVFHAMLGKTIKTIFVSETNSLPPITCTITSDGIFVCVRHHIMDQSHLVFVCLIGIWVLQRMFKLWSQADLDCKT